MLTIQDVGTEVLCNNPRNFYIFGGTEYGIKRKYISFMRNHYGNYTECQAVAEVIKLMTTHHFIPLEPTLYVIRYDEDFVSDISDDYAKRIKSANIIGTIVCIYESDKQINKLAKYLPDATVRIDPINPVYKIKYLHSDFPKLPDRLINLAANYSYNYNDAILMCSSMSKVQPEELFALSDMQFLELFGKKQSYTDNDIKIGVASRNFTHLVNIIEDYDGELDKVFYSILSTMIEMEKILSSKYSQSDLKEYSGRWTLKDVYNMFMHTYDTVRKLRSYSTDAKSGLIYLFSLLKFSQIPSVEFMGSEL